MLGYWTVKMIKDELESNNGVKLDITPYDAKTVITNNTSAKVRILMKMDSKVTQ